MRILLFPGNDREQINYKIEDFLAWLYGQNEVEIYYFLLNNTQIISFQNSEFEVAVTDTTNLHKSIRSLLFKWTGKEWNVILTRKTAIITMKDQLINQFKAGSAWQLIHDHFPSVDIADILLKSKG